MPSCDWSARPVAPPPGAPPHEHARLRTRKLDFILNNIFTQCITKMSLWTPYDPEQVLDLSKTHVQETVIKSERCTPPYYQPYPYDPYYSRSPLVSPTNPHLYEGCSVTTSPPASSPDSACERVSSSSSSRPFKAVTAGLELELGGAAAPDPNYAAFRATMLEAMKARNGGTLTVTNPRMRRSVRGRRSSEADDSDYLERRARNNAAAKRSRDLRKQKEDELAIRVAYLERKYADLLALHEARICLRCRTTLSTV